MDMHSWERESDRTHVAVSVATYTRMVGGRASEKIGDLPFLGSGFARLPLNKSASLAIVLGALGGGAAQVRRNEPAVRVRCVLDVVVAARTPVELDLEHVRG
jgi:hypothetical protein